MTFAVDKRRVRRQSDVFVPVNSVCPIGDSRNLREDLQGKQEVVSSARRRNTDDLESTIGRRDGVALDGQRAVLQVPLAEQATVALHVVRDISRKASMVKIFNSRLHHARERLRQVRLPEYVPQCGNFTLYEKEF